MKDKNRNGITLQEFDKDVAAKLKNYFLITVSKKQGRTIRSMWRQGCDPSDAVSYVLLDSTKLK